MVKDGVVIALGHNTVLLDHDPTAHAEVNALRAAAKKLGTPHLAGCVLLATSEPCPMCLAAANWARVDEIRYALPREKAAAWGFDDAFFYDDLARPPHERRVPSVQIDAPPGAEERLISAWKERSGEIY